MALSWKMLIEISVLLDMCNMPMELAQLDVESCRQCALTSNKNDIDNRTFIMRNQSHERGANNYQYTGNTTLSKRKGYRLGL